MTAWDFVINSCKIILKLIYQIKLKSRKKNSTKMKILIFAFALVAVTSAASLTDVSLNNFWTQFKRQHNKVYANSEEEVQRRLVWESNLKFIRQHNLEADLGQHTYKVGINRYADMVRYFSILQLNSN